MDTFALVFKDTPQILPPLPPQHKGADVKTDTLPNLALGLENDTHFYMMTLLHNVLKSPQRDTSVRNAPNNLA